jgi:hypothetical protein
MWKWIRILKPRPLTGYKGNILLANRHNQSYTIREKPLEPKFHLALAFTCKRPALQRNVVQYWEMDQEFGKSTTHRLWSSYTPWNKTQPEVCHQKKSDGTKIPSSTGHYMRNNSIIEKSSQILGNGSGFWNQDPTTGYKGDILLVHRHNLKSAITKKMLEPKSHLSLAIACETLA